METAKMLSGYNKTFVHKCTIAKYNLIEVNNGVDGKGISRHFYKSKLVCMPEFAQHKS